MAMASNESNTYSRSQVQAYGWRAFLLEFLCGMIAITWYLLFLAERIILRWLTRLEKLVTPPSDDPPVYGNAQNVLAQEERSTFRQLAEEVPTGSYELSRVGVNKSASFHRT
jgi:hypothetical protein